MEKFKIKRRIVIEEEVTFNKYIALQVEMLRKASNFTQEEFANRLGLTRTSVVNMEKGRQQISMKNLYLICKTLGCKSKDILPF